MAVAEAQWSTQQVVAHLRARGAGPSGGHDARLERRDHHVVHVGAVHVAEERHLGAVRAAAVGRREELGRRARLGHLEAGRPLRIDVVPRRAQAAPSVAGALVARLPQGSFASAEEANSAAMAFMEMVLAHERTGDGGRSLSAPRDDVDAEWSTGFKVPKTSAAPELLTTVDSCGTYGAKVTLFCDVHGADVHNVVVATLKASVVPA